mgnify:CR=1 FL=1
MAEDRVTELETQFMHLEKMVEQLNDVVIEQQARIEQLQRELQALREAAAQPDEDVDEPPPHY